MASTHLTTRPSHAGKNDETPARLDAATGVTLQGTPHLPFYAPDHWPLTGRFSGPASPGTERQFRQALHRTR